MPLWAAVYLNANKFVLSGHSLFELKSPPIESHRRTLMKIHVLVLAVLIFAVAANAADINGKWVAQVTSPSGSKTERVFVFQASGEKVTGTIANIQVAQATFEEKGKPPMVGTLKTQNADPQAIADGKITGDSLTFAIVSQMFGQEMKTEYKGKVSGDEIKFTVEQGGGMGGGMGGPGAGPQEIVAKKVK
jgi:hypothetical protein